MKLGPLAAKLVRRYTRWRPTNRWLLRNTLRKWFVDCELLSSTKEGFNMLASPYDYASYGIFFFGEYDPIMSRFFRGQIFEGATCMDIGSERGWFTLQMAHLVGPTGRVDAFEPFPRNFQKLKANIELNRFHWVNPYQIAVSDSEGEMSFVPPEYGLLADAPYLEGCSGAGYLSQETEGKTDIIRVKTLRLEEHAARTNLTRLDFVKIDVEGAEVAVLHGAEAVLREMRPTIAIEYNRLALERAGASVEQLDELLDCFGYDRFIFEDRLMRYRRELYCDRPSDKQVVNVYCLPRR